MNPFSLNQAISEYIEKQDSDSIYKSNILENNKNKKQNKLKYIVDFENSWQFLMGPNQCWSSGGGEWPNVRMFYTSLNRACENAGIQLIFFFDGTIPKCFDSFEWLNKRKNLHQKVKDIYHSAKNFSKVYPHFLNEFVQLFILTNNKKIERGTKNLYGFQSLENHQREILEFARINQCNGIITDDFDIISLLMFEKFRSSMTNVNIYSGSTFKFENHFLSACLINTDKILDALKMNIDQFKWFSFLLSSQTSQKVSGEFLTEFYKRLTNDIINLDIMKRQSYMILIEKIHKFVFRFNLPIDYKHIMKCILNRRIEDDDREFLIYADSFFDGSATVHAFKYDWKFFTNKHKASNLEDGSNPRFFNSNMNLTFNCYLDRFSASSSDINEIEKPKRNYMLVEEYSYYEADNMKLNSTFIDTNTNKVDSITLVEEESLIFKEEMNLTDLIQNMHVNCSRSKWVSQAYFKKKIVLPIYFEPYNEHVAIKCDEIYRPIRSLCYGLLFSGMKPCFDIPEYKNDKITDSAFGLETNTDSILVEEIVYEPKEKVMKTIPLKIQPLTQDYNIKTFWNNKTFRDRFDMFLFIIRCCELTDHFFDINGRYDIKNFFDQHFIVPCLVLRYLLLKNYLVLSSKDIYAFLVTFVWVAQNQYCRHDKMQDRIIKKAKDPRAAHLSTLFLAGLENFCFANDTCGRPLREENFLISAIFSGTFFQVAYENAILGNPNFLKDLHNNNTYLVRDKLLLSKLESFVISGLSDKLIDTPCYEPYKSENFRITKFQTEKTKQKLNAQAVNSNILKSGKGIGRGLGRGLLGMQQINKFQMNNLVEAIINIDYNNNDSKSNYEDNEPNNLNVNKIDEKKDKKVEEDEQEITVNKDILDEIILREESEQKRLNRERLDEYLGKQPEPMFKMRFSFFEKLREEYESKQKSILESNPKVKEKKEPQWIPISEMPFLIRNKFY